MSEHITNPPDFLERFFWDYEFRELTWKDDSDLITSRLLRAGDWRSISWLREQTTDDELRTWLLEHKGGGLSPRQLRYWQVVLELPSRQVDRWVRSSMENPWGRRTGV